MDKLLHSCYPSVQSFHRCDVRPGPVDLALRWRQGLGVVEGELPTGEGLARHLYLSTETGSAPPATTQWRPAERCPSHAPPASHATRDATTSWPGGIRLCGYLAERMRAPPTTKPCRTASPGRMLAPLLSHFQAAACMSLRTLLGNVRTYPACQTTRRSCKTSGRTPWRLGGTTVPNHRRQRALPEVAPHLPQLPPGPLR